MKTYRISWIVLFALIALPVIVFYSCDDDGNNDIINENLSTVITEEVTNITQTTAKSGGNITGDGGSAVTARGVIWSTSANLNLNNNEGMTTEGAGAGGFTSNITGLEPETQYYVRAYATNSHGTGYGNALVFTTLKETTGTGTGTVTDIDGNVYQTVIIGSQEWMAENLRVAKYNNGDAIPTDLSNTDWISTTEGAYAIYPHGDINGINSPEEMVAAYGKLYNWYAFDDARGLCPEGWSAPSGGDWETLINYVVAQGFPNEWENSNGAGNALKSCRQVSSPLDGECNTSIHPRWFYYPLHFGFDEFGFSALPGGRRIAFGSISFGSFGGIGSNGSWWTSGEASSEHAYSQFMDSYYGIVGMDYRNKRDGFSIRCVKN